MRLEKTGVGLVFSPERDRTKTTKKIFVASPILCPVSLGTFLFSSPILIEGRKKINFFVRIYYFLFFVWVLKRW